MSAQHPPRFDLVGIGNALMDVIAPVSDAFLAAEAMDKGGMALIGEPRALDIDAKLRTGREVTETAGGSGANTIAGASELGLRTAYIARVADDPTGRAYADAMTASGVTFPNAPAEQDAATGRCLIAVTPDGERTMNTFLGTSVAFETSDLPDAIIRDAAILYLEGYLFDADPAKAAFVHASEVARAAGRLVALTLSDTFCVDRHRDSFQQLVEHNTDIVFANESEILALYNTNDLDSVADRLSATRTLVFVTRGDQGALVIDGDQRHHVPARPVAIVTDTTGAGDQFAAGTLAALAMGLSPQDAAHLGNIAAGEVIQHFGPRPQQSVHDLIVSQP